MLHWSYCHQCKLRMGNDFDELKRYERQGEVW